MSEIKILDGIEVGKRYDEYTEQELSVMPPVPQLEKGKDYPEYYEKAPLYWYGYGWELIFE